MIAVDLFAGAGGSTTGAAQAGARVLWAANHWPAAVEIHRANHPHVTHLCQDLHLADWSQVPDHDLLLASPACQGHSRARGRAQICHDTSRSTAWAVVSCAEARRPAVVIVENVTEFRHWSLFPAWKLAMEALGYRLAEYLINAADCSIPQDRRRLFIVCTRGARPLRFPCPEGPRRGALDLIRWEQGAWSSISRPGRSAATLARVAAGRRAFGWRFVMPYYSSGSGLTGRSLDRPIGTLTTRDRWAVVDGDRMRMLIADEVRAGMGFPEGYVLPRRHREAVHMLGNAVCPPVMRWLVEQVRKAG